MVTPFSFHLSIVCVRISRLSAASKHSSAFLQKLLRTACD